MIFPKMHISDGSDLAQLAADTDMLVINFPRKDVEQCSMNQALGWLLPLSDSPDLVAKLASSVTILFDGYDDDPRELCDIPECRQFVRKLNTYWPYWYHFLNKDDNSFSTLFRLLCDTERVSVRPGMVGYCFTSIDTVRKQAMSLFTAMNALYLRHDLSKAQNAAMTEKVIVAFNKMLGD